MQRQPIAQISYPYGFAPSLQAFDAKVGTSALGSANNLLLGEGYSVPFAGFTAKSGTGTRIALQVGKTWGGIRDNGGTSGAGSFFEDIGRSLWGIGAGIPSKEGTDISGFTLSSTLQVSIATSGAYGSGTTYQVGLGQPSAPTVGIPAATGVSFTGLINGTISVKLVRFRSTTGDLSRPSTTSAVVSVTNKTIRITFPSASTGQDYWRIFVTQQGFGGVGLHYALPYSGSYDVAESTVNGSSIDSISRTMEFDFQDGDLGTDAAELNYIDNYPPPAGTHAVRLENVMCVLGCYADSSTSPTSTNTGTCIAVSLPNFYGSYKPNHILFLPEQIVSVLSRPTDSFAWIGCKNSIYTLQYVGLRDAPACTVATAFPNIGVAYHHNWCQVYGRIALFTSKGNLVMIDESGDLNDKFSAPIKKFIKNWATSETVLGFDAQINCLILANNKTMLAYCFDSGEWSDPHYSDDAGISGNVLSATTSEGKLIMTYNNSGTHTAYEYNTGATKMPICKVSQWQEGQGVKSIYEMELAVNNSNVSYPIAVALQKNLKPIVTRAASITSGGNTVSLSETILNASHVGLKVFIYGEAIGGGSVHYLSGKIGTQSGNSFTLVNSVGSAVNASATYAKCYVLFGDYIAVKTATYTGEQHLRNLFPAVQEARSLALAVWQMSDASTGSFLNSTLIGTGGSSVAA